MRRHPSDQIPSRSRIPRPRLDGQLDLELILSVLLLVVIAVVFWMGFFEAVTRGIGIG